MTDAAALPTVLPTADQIAESDLVVQFAVQHGFPKTSVYRAYRPFFKNWVHLDPEDGADGTYTYEAESLAILMTRDRMTGMAAIAFPPELGALTEAHLDSLDRHAIVIADTPLTDQRLVLQKYQSSWWNLETGVEETYTSAELVAWFKGAAVVWEFPDTAT